MALDREKAFANAERLLKQGKASQALEECQRLAEDAPKDLLMLNRIGDLLARAERGPEAIVYYDRIADQFSASGFYPKAIAILKKIVKVAPNRLETIVRLGELNLKQKLPGEARAWFLQASDAYLRNREFAKARDVYEKLVAAEPDNFAHAVRLAEARAAEGDAERGGRELVALGSRMLAGHRIEDAERTFKRAAELLPGRAEPAVGLARCHAAAGRKAEALTIADDVWPARAGAESVAGDLLVLLETLGEFERSARLLDDAKSDAIADDAVELAMRAALSRGDAEGLWSRLMPLIDRWARAGEFGRAATFLERLARTEDGGHLRALEQLVELRKAEGNRTITARAIERLVRASQAKGSHEKIEALLDTLKLIDPTSPLLFVGRPSGHAEAARPAAAPVAPAPREAPKHAAEPTPVALEAPAVPLGSADEEFVSGHLTEAEVFEKYGLHSEALQQLQHVVLRFPGHVAASEKLIGLLRTRSDRGALRDALVGSAFAKRAAGDVEGARRAAGEAATLGGIDAGLRTALEKFALLSAAKVESKAQPVSRAPAPSPTPAPAKAPAKAAPPPAPPPPPAAKAPAAPPPVARASAAAPPVSRAEEEDLEILFDDVEEEAGTSSAVGDVEWLEEIEFYIGQGMNADALSRIAAARAAGRDREKLDALEARARASSAAGEPEIVDEADSMGGDRLDEAELSSIAAALDAEYGAERAAPAAPADPDAEQSIDEVFAAFKEHVRAEVEGGDYRTHYDLGIAYKEMGLVEDAIEEFKTASEAPELYREACSMLGLCHWERGETDDAIHWYRAALEAPGDEEAPLSGLRYDLAEILFQTGDHRGALDLYAQIAAVEPHYRDVENRLTELRRNLSP